MRGGGGVVNLNTAPGAASSAAYSYDNTATDNVGVTSGPTRTSGLASGSIFPIGDTVVTHTAADAAGNTTTASFTVRVTDNENPSIIAPPFINVGTDPGSATAVVNFTVSATDNSATVDSGLSSLVVSPASGSAFPIGANLVTVTATDHAGNTAHQSFFVTVADDEAPMVTPPAHIAVSTDPGLNTAVVTFTPTATDNVGVTSLVSSPPSGSAFPLGTTSVSVTATDAEGNSTVVYRATDNSGNTSTASFTVTVEDNAPRSFPPYRTSRAVPNRGCPVPRSTSPPWPSMRCTGQSR